MSIVTGANGTEVFELSKTKLVAVVSTVVILVIIIVVACNILYCMVCQAKSKNKRHKRKHGKNDDDDDDDDDDDEEEGKTEAEREAKRRRKKQRQKEREKRKKQHKLENKKNNSQPTTRMLATTTTPTNISPPLTRSPTEQIMDQLMNMPTSELMRLIELSKERNRPDIARFGMEVARMLDMFKSKKVMRMPSKISNKTFVQKSGGNTTDTIKTLSPKSQFEVLNRLTAELENNFDNKMNKERLFNQLWVLKRKGGGTTGEGNGGGAGGGGFIVVPPKTTTASTNRMPATFSRPMAKEVSHKSFSARNLPSARTSESDTFSSRSVTAKRRPSISYEFSAKRSKSNRQLRQLLDGQRAEKATTELAPLDSIERLLLSKTMSNVKATPTKSGGTL